MATNSIEKGISGCFGQIFLENGPNDLVKGLILSIDIELYISPTCGPLSTFFGSILGCPNGRQMVKNSLRNLFSG
jgi:ABC-type dipeptide/oligopeptide/nickel transport system permease subunit